MVKPPWDIVTCFSNKYCIQLIATMLNLSAQTVSTYRSRIRQKTKMKNPGEKTAYAMKNQLLSFIGVTLAWDLLPHLL